MVLESNSFQMAMLTKENTIKDNPRAMGNTSGNVELFLLGIFQQGIEKEKEK